MSRRISNMIVKSIFLDKYQKIFTLGSVIESIDNGTQICYYGHGNGIKIKENKI